MKVVLLMMVMVQMAYFALAQVPTSTTQMPQTIPSCFSEKLTTCAQNFSSNMSFESTATTNITNPSDIEMPCCSEWSDEIKNNIACVCDYAKPYLSLMTDFFTMCKIDANATTMCQGISSKTGNGGSSSEVNSNNTKGNGSNKIAHSVGFLPVLLLIFAVFVAGV